MKIRYVASAAASMAAILCQAQDRMLSVSTAAGDRATSAAAAQAACRAAARATLHDHGIERGYGPTPIRRCNSAPASPTQKPKGPVSTDSGDSQKN